MSGQKVTRQCGAGLYKSLALVSVAYDAVRRALGWLFSRPYDHRSGSLPTNETGEPFVTTLPDFKKAAKAARLLLLLGPSRAANTRETLVGGMSACGWLGDIQS